MVNNITQIPRRGLLRLAKRFALAPRCFAKLNYKIMFYLSFPLILEDKFLKVPL